MRREKRPLSAATAPRGHTSPDRAASIQRGRGRAAATLVLEQAAIDIVGEIQPCSVRAVAYKLFTRGLIEDMLRNATNKVSALLTRLREERLIPWAYIVDTGRLPDRIQTWHDPAQIVEAAVRGYRRDAWREQPRRVQVVVEKGTVQSTIAPVLEEFGVTCRTMRGYGSATALNDLAEEAQADVRPLLLLYLGDHDPSGRHMSEIDIPERLDRYGGTAQIRRLAIDESDARKDSGLPEFNADTKIGDARYKWFVRRYGRRCVELDALDPPVLRKRLHDAIEALIEPESWAHSKRIEAAEVESMRLFHEQAKSILRLAPKCSSGGPA